MKRRIHEDYVLFAVVASIGFFWGLAMPRLWPGVAVVLNLAAAFLLFRDFKAWLDARSLEREVRYRTEFDDFQSATSRAFFRVDAAEVQPETMRMESVLCCWDCGDPVNGPTAVCSACSAKHDLEAKIQNAAVKRPQEPQTLEL